MGGKIRTASARDNGSNHIRPFSRRHQRRRRSRARAEVSELEVASRGLLRHPISGSHESVRQEADVKAKMSRSLVKRFLLFCEKVHEQSRQVCLLQHVSDMLIARAVAAASASVSKDDDIRRVPRHGQVGADSD